MDVPVDDSDQAEAVSRMVLGLTLAAGGMVALGAAVAGSIVVAVPTVLLLARATAAAGWCGVAIWVVLVLMAPYDGIVAPLVMIAACVMIALRPSRVFAWFTEPPQLAAPGSDLEPAWIEEL